MAIAMGMASSQHKDEVPIGISSLKVAEVPIGFPEIDYPKGNEYSKERWNLGKKLFYDKAFSKDGRVSCGSCHKAEFAFADNKQFSPGSENADGTRNSPSLANIAYHPYFTREGGVPTLEMQVLVPIQEHNEFNNNIVLIAEELGKDSRYQQMSREAYKREMDAFVITRALANFERTLLSGNSAYDQYFNQNDEGALNDQQLRGYNLFYGKARCGTCHADFNFTNYDFENNGLYKVYEDIGRNRLTLKEEDIALFKVPSLRNVALTSPYMHDGSFNSLEEVVAHYNSGGKAHQNKNQNIKPLSLSETEQQDLVSFLRALTDTNFTQNENFKE